MKIKNKLILYFALISVVPLVLFTLITVQFNKKTLSNEILENERLLIETKVSLVNHLLDNLKKDLLSISVYPPIQGLIRAEKSGIDPLDKSTDSQWKSRLEQLFKTKMENSNQIFQIRYIRNNGDEIVRVNKDFKGDINVVPDEDLQNKKHRTYFQKTIGMGKSKIYISEVDYNQENGQIKFPKHIVFRLGVPIYDEITGKIYGGVFINVDFKKFLEPLITKIDQVKNKSYVITDQSGHFLYSKDKNKWLKFLDNPDFPSFFQEIPKIKINLRNDNQNSYFDKESGNFLTWNKIYYGSDQSDYWYFFSITQESIKYKPINQLKVISMTLLLIILLFTLLIAFFLGSNISKPLMKLTEQALSIASGHQETKIEVENPKGEIKDLVLAFKKMRGFLSDAAEEIKKQQQELQLIFDNVPARIWYKDDKNRILKLNRSAAASMGGSVEDFEGKNTYDLFPDMAEKYHNDDLSVINSNKPIINMIEEYTPLDGQKGWSSTDKIPYYDVVTGKRNIIVISQDITALKQKEIELENTNDVLKFIQDETNDGWWDWDLTGDRTNEYLSPKWKALFGYKDHELPNKVSAWQDMIYKEDLDKIIENFNKHIETNGKHPFNLEVRYKHKNGKTIWVICRGKAFKNEEGEYVRMVGTHTDITSLKETRNQLQKSYEELEQFSYIASHDLQEPLRKIQGFGEILQKKYSDKLDETGKSFMNKMQNAAQRMSDLISALLRYSRVTKSDDPFERLDLNEVIKDVLSDLELAIKDSGAKIEYEKLPVIDGDKFQIQQLFQNLISNSIKYVSAGVEPNIRIQTKKIKNGKIKIIFLDNGIGIKKEYYEKVFQPFKRLHTRDQYKGTGIGLSLCMKIVEKHGGKIYIESEYGKGSRFIIELPVLHNQKTNATF